MTARHTDSVAVKVVAVTEWGSYCGRVLTRDGDRRRLCGLEARETDATGAADRSYWPEEADLGAPSASQQLRAALHRIEADSDTTFLHAWGLSHGLAGLAAAGITSPDDIRDALTAFTATLTPPTHDTSLNHRRSGW